MKHRHAEIIKAKADNTHLSVFCRDTYPPDNGWVETSQWPIQEEFEYFLCQPQHHTPCLHWLNGGEVQYLNSVTGKWSPVETINEAIENECDRLECTLEELTTVYKYNPTEWSHDSIFMNDSFELRIKPKKEKLYIAVKTDKHEHLGGCRKVRICSHAFVSKEDAESYLDLSDSQLIEIEVEVEE